jgi:hypothetical protein
MPRLAFRLARPRRRCASYFAKPRIAAAIVSAKGNFLIELVPQDRRARRRRRIFWRRSRVKKSIVLGFLYMPCVSAHVYVTKQWFLNRHCGFDAQLPPRGNARQRKPLHPRNGARVRLLDLLVCDHHAVHRPSAALQTYPRLLRGVPDRQFDLSCGCHGQARFRCIVRPGSFLCACLPRNFCATQLVWRRKSRKKNHPGSVGERGYTDTP